MNAYRTKRPDEAESFALEWPALEPSEVLAEDLGWMVVPAEPGPDGLSIAGEAMEAARSVAVLTGGRVGHLYHVSQRVRTSLGRVLSGALLVRVAAG